MFPVAESYAIEARQRALGLEGGESILQIGPGTPGSLSKVMDWFPAPRVKVLSPSVLAVSLVPAPLYVVHARCHGIPLLSTPLAEVSAHGHGDR